MAGTTRYVRSDAAGGGDGTTDTNSGANGAYTITEAAAVVGTGIDFHVKTGTYTLAANLTLGAGSTESPNRWIGFKTTPGDLESVGRATATGELDDTDFPIIDGVGSYGVTMGSHNSLRCLTITGSANGVLLTASTSYHVWRVRIEQSNASGSSAKCFSNSTNYGSLSDCDLLLASTSGSAVIVSVGRGGCVGCRVWHTGSPASGSIGISAIDVGSTVHGCIVYNVGIGIDVGANTGAFSSNTIHGCVDGIRLGNNGAIIAENIIYSMSGYGIKGNTSSGNPLILNNAMGSLTSGRIDTTGAGTVIEEVLGVTLTGDPFTNAAGGDYTLNSTSGAGALCRAASEFFGGQRDLGAVQHTDSGGGTPAFAAIG